MSNNGLNIYGQFAAHLGHCIYGGIWVGEDSPIPNCAELKVISLAAASMFFTVKPELF